MRISPLKHTYRKNKNKEIEEKIKKQKEQGNAYFDEEALIEYLKQNMINYGNGINSGVSTGNNTLNNIKTYSVICKELRMSSEVRFTQIRQSQDMR